jgi:hypothetical protein
VTRALITGKHPWHVGLVREESKTGFLGWVTHLGGLIRHCPFIPIVIYKLAGLRIRIRIGSGFNRVSESGSGSGSRRAKMTHKSRNFFQSSCFEVLDGLFFELKASSVTLTYFMEAWG